MLRTSLCAFLSAVLLAVVPLSSTAQQPVVNVYSARHYQTDEALYADFTKQTGIRVHRIEAGDEALLERLRNEGANSPADVLLLVDAARLWKAQAEGLFQPIRSPLLEGRIPPTRRSADAGNGSEWFGMSARARVIVYNKIKVDPALVQNYEDLARPELKGLVCTRSGAHPYMLSLIATMSEHLGEAKAEEWARGVVANFARSPRGGDTDQIRAVASGECGVALTNTYYLVRLLRRGEDQEVASRVGMVWPNQKSFGTHVNVAGAGVAKHAPNRDNAIRFVEYLASDSAQRYFAAGNNEWPVVAGVDSGNRALESLGRFKADELPIEAIGRGQASAARIIDRSGWR